MRHNKASVHRQIKALSALTIGPYDLKAIDAKSLFPRVTTWLGFPRDRVLRGYMVDFIHLFAPHYSPRLIREVASLETQEQVDELVADSPLPVRGGCEQDTAAAA